MKSRILFVDDEINILKGLRRMLRNLRQEWDMTFVNNGEKALALMQDNFFDVVVSDMKMPGMDGAVVLDKVRLMHPKTVRIILSGYSDQEAILRTVGPAHQYLAKPCNADVLVDTINRALKLRRLLDKEDLRELVAGLDHLPSPPEVFSRLLCQFDSPLAGGVEIANTISEDLAMTAQTLKLINSAYFSLPQKVDDLHLAVRLLGIDTLKALVLVSGFFKQFSGDAKMGDRIETLSGRCLSIGMTAKAIAAAEGYSDRLVDQASSAGVLAHIGTLALMAKWPTRYGQAIDEIEENHMSIVDAEHQVFGAAHSEIGAYLLGLWGFSDSIIEAVVYHHSPWLMPVGEKKSITICVYVAQHLLKTVSGSITAEEISDGAGLDMDYLRKCGLDDKVPFWIDLVKKLKAKTEEVIIK